MADLTAGKASGTQATTQNPQISGTANNNAAKGSSVQPGTASNLLKSNNGISLQQPPLNTVKLDTASQVASVQPAPKPKNDVNIALFIVPAVLIILAVGMVWSTARSAKNTTY